MLFWLSVIEALDIRLCGYIDIMDNQLWIMELSDLKSLTSLQGDDFPKNVQQMSYYHGNFNISVMNNYFILKIPG